MPKIRKAVIPVAGLGTRFLPATKAQPKEMLALVDKPIIQYLVEEAVAAGIEDIIFITSQTKRAIEDHFDRNFELEYRLEQSGKDKMLAEIKKISNLANFIYIRQKSPRGWGDAILQAQNVVGNEPFAVFLGDDIIDSKQPAIGQLMAIHEKYGDGVLGVTEVPKHKTGSYGVVDAVALGGTTYQVKAVVEKPEPAKAPSNLAVTGRYVFTPEIFDILKKMKPDAKGEVVGTEAIKILLKKRPFYACKYDGTYYDCGSKVGFLKATVVYGLKHQEIKDEFRDFLKTLKIK